MPGDFILEFHLPIGRVTVGLGSPYIYIYMYIYIYGFINIYIHVIIHIPVVPRKAVAEVSKIGNL